MLKISSPSATAWERGFTITELMVVIGIIATVVAISAISIADYQRKSRLREAARAIEADLSQIRMIARTRQEMQLVTTVSTTGRMGYVAYSDTNMNSAYDAGETTFLIREFTKGETLAITSSTPGAMAPFESFTFNALGALRVPNNREIVVSVPSESARRYRITLHPTGLTQVSRSDDGGATWPTRGY